MQPNSNADLEQQLQACRAETAELALALQAERSVRQQVEETLRETERKFQAVFEQTQLVLERDIIQLNHSAQQELEAQTTEILESMTDGFYALDRNWCFTYVNLQAERLLQRTREQLLGHSIWEVYPEAVDTPFYHDYHQAMSQNMSFHAEEFCSSLNSWFEVHAYPAKDGLSVYLQPISDRKLAEQALYQREQEFRALAENAPDIIARFDKQLRHSYINAAAEPVFGLSPAAIIGKTCHDLGLQGALCSCWDENLQQVFTTGCERSIEFDLLTPDGRTKSYQTRIAPEFAQDGSVESIVTIARDVTEFKQTERALRENQKLLQAILDATPAYIFVKDLQGRYLLSSRRYVEDVLGLSQEQMIGKTDYDLFPQEMAELFRANDQAVLEAGIPVNFEESALPDGLDTVIATKFPLYDLSGVPYAICGITVDITERKQLEQALHQREQEFRSLAENSPDIIARFDRQLRHQYVNLAGAAASGLSPEALIGKTHRDLGLPEAQCEFWENQFQHVLTTKQEQIIEFDFVTPDNVTRYYHSRRVPEFAPDGSVETILVVARDVTDLKQTEQALRESQQLLQAILDAAPLQIYMKDLQGRYLLVNRQGEQAVSLSREQIISKTDYDLYPREIADSYRSSDQATLEAGTPLEWEQVLSETNGTRTFITNKFPLYDATGTAYAICGIVAEITERKQMETALKESEERFRQLAENVDAVFWMRSLDEQQNKQEFLYISPAYEKIWGRTRESLYQKPESWLDAVHPEDLPNLTALTEQRCQGEYPVRQYRIVLSDGSIRWIQDRTFPIYKQGRIYRVAGITEDISQSKGVEEQIKASLQEKEALLKEVHHRVKNNLQVISSLLDLQAQQLENAIAIEAFQECQNRVKSIAIIHEKLYQSENLANINLADYIYTLASYLLQTYPINPNDITLELNVDEIFLAIDIVIPCGLIINELVSNALKHGFPKNAQGKIWIRLNSVNPYTDNNSKQLSLVIGNNGTKLKDPQCFYKANSLGFQLVKTLVNQLEGQIEISQDQGTEFKINFPYL